jgi:hypothetical protein
MGEAVPVRKMTYEELQQAAQNLAGKLHQRQEPHALAVLDTLANWVTMAEDPGNPAYLQARNNIQQWAQLNDRIRAIASGIQLPKQ